MSEEPEIIDAPDIVDAPELEDAPEPLSLYDLCETDVEAEENGRWFKDIFGDGSDINVKLRRFTSKASIDVRRRLEKQYKPKQNSRGEYSEEVGTQILCDQVAGAIIVDWENVRGRDRQLLPFTYANARKLLMDLRVFRETVVIMSNAMDNFRLEQSEDAEKN